MLLDVFYNPIGDMLTFIINTQFCNILTQNLDKNPLMFIIYTKYNKLIYLLEKTFLIQ